MPKNNIMDTLLKVNKMRLEEPCRKCGNKTLEKRSSLFGGPYGGVVTCLTTGCDLHETVYSYLGRSMFKVEPMPEGTDTVFLPKEDDDAEDT